MSSRVTQTMTMRTLLADIQAAGARVAQTQTKLASGREVATPSDNPSAATRALQFRWDLEATRQYQSNVSEASAWQEVTDTTLRQIGEMTLRARELVIQSATDTLGSTSREAIALEFEQLIDSIKSTANAQYAGRFVLAGTATDTAPYALGGSDVYDGNLNVVEREVGKNVRLDMNEFGVDVVGEWDAGTGTGTGLLKTLRTITDDLRNNRVTKLGTDDLRELDQAHDALITARARVGARANRLETALSRLQELEQSTTKLLSDTEDADMSEQLVRFSMQQSVYQSALRTGAQIIQPSLIDFLR